MGSDLISIVIGSIRPLQLTSCLDSIHCCTGDINYEVVVVSPFEVPQHPKVVHVREKELRGYYNAIADGCEAAQGDYIIHIADDCRATPQWASNMIAFMNFHQGEIFEGSFRHFDVRGERPEQGHYGKLIAPFICIGRETLSRVGGMIMDTNYRRFFGDPDLSLKVWANGGNVLSAPDAWIYHCDYDDDQYKKAYNQYFEKDRQTFINRWYPVFGRQGDAPLGHEQPLRKGISPIELPPEQVTQIYASLQRRDWDTVENIIKFSKDCVYAEGFPVLHRLVKAKLENTLAPRAILYSVLHWLAGKGYAPASTLLESEKKFSIGRILRRYSIGIALSFATITRTNKLAARLVPQRLKQWLGVGQSLLG